MSTPLAITTLLRILVPFACGYFLSYLYRSVNAVISPDLISTFSLNATDLGLLTSVYFLAFSLSQLPVGIALDRFGPRRVEAVLLVFAASGALIFSLSDTREGLIVGRALIGLGVSACLMASLKATSSWFPPVKVPAMNGWIMMAGGLGALTATQPVEYALSTITDWRGVMMALAALTYLVAVLLFLVVPDRPQQSTAGLRELLSGLVQIYRSRFFWTVVPLTVLTQGLYMSIQGLWAAPWLKDVAGLERAEVANHLFLIAAAMVAGFLLIGNIASRLVQRGITLGLIVAVCMLLFMLAQLLIILEWITIALPLWLIFGFFGSAGILSFPLMSQRFPGEFTGRVNTAANVLVFMSAFLSQWLIGAIINLWPTTANITDPTIQNYNPLGYQAAFTLFLSLQFIGWLWFLFGMRRDRNTHEQ